MENRQDLANTDPEALLEEVADNPGARAAAINANPLISQEEARNANEGKGPNAAGGIASSSAENFVPGTSDPESSNLPTANAPNPAEVNARMNPNSTKGKQSGGSC